MAIKEGLWDQVDRIAEESDMEWIYDDRKEGEAKYHGILDPECMV